MRFRWPWAKPAPARPTDPPLADQVAGRLHRLADEWLAQHYPGQMITAIPTDPTPIHPHVTLRSDKARDVIVLAVDGQWAYEAYWLSFKRWRESKAPWRVTRDPAALATAAQALGLTDPAAVTGLSGAAPQPTAASLSRETVDA